MAADLLARARSAVTVEEECDVIDEALPEMWRGSLVRLDDLVTAVDHVRLGFLPRAVLLGVVAALVPEGWTAWEDAEFGRAPTPALALLIAILEASNAGS